MPPREKPQPTAEERHQLVAWTRGFLDAEARARTGDPGRTLLRRLSNAEYDATIRDLTGVDLRPAREFPADGAGGEGFTNAGESLSEISPALFARYMAAAVDGVRKRRRGGRVAAVQNGGAQPCSFLGGEDRVDSPDHPRSRAGHRSAQRHGDLERELLGRMSRSGMIANIRKGLYLFPPRLPLGGI